jgi:Family of unknown function (DUF6502)
MTAAVAVLQSEPRFGPVMSDDVKSPLLSAFRHLLRPLIRILLRHGVAFGELADVIKAVYVEIARREFSLPDKPQSDSRVAILTGLTRKEVHRIRTHGPNFDSDSNLSRVARVLQGWTQDPEFVGPYGVPLEIPFSGDQGLSFTELVRRYSGDMPPRAMLDELIRVRAVLETPDSYVRLLNRTYLPSPLDPAGLERLGNVVHYFVDTVDHNLQKKRQGLGRFERYALTLEGLTPADFRRFDDLVREKGQEFLELLDNWLTSHEVKGGHKLPSSKAIKTGVGVFHFLEQGQDSDG